MAETIVKVGNYEVEVTAPVAPIISRHKLKRLRDDLQQAKDSKDQVLARQAAELAPIQATIDLFKARLDAAKLLISDEPADIEPPVTP